MVQSAGYPISCQPPSPSDMARDELDSAVNYWLANAARQKSSGSETESDEDTEMTVIKNKADTEVLKAASKPRHGSERSYGKCDVWYTQNFTSSSPFQHTHYLWQSTSLGMVVIAVMVGVSSAYRCK